MHGQPVDINSDEAKCLRKIVYIPDIQIGLSDAYWKLEKIYRELSGIVEAEPIDYTLRGLRGRFEHLNTSKVGNGNLNLIKIVDQRDADILVTNVILKYEKAGEPISIALIATSLPNDECIEAFRKAVLQSQQIE